MAGPDKARDVRVLNQSEIEDFLASPWIATLATIRPNGKPQLTPIWYTYERGFFYFTTDRRRVKASNLSSTKKAYLCIHNGTTLPYTYVTVEGDAEMTEIDPYAMTFRIAERYLGSETARKYAGVLLKGQRIVVAVKPRRMLGISNA